MAFGLGDYTCVAPPLHAPRVALCVDCRHPLTFL
jgi:hypothetical protein